MIIVDFNLYIFYTLDKKAYYNKNNVRVDGLIMKLFVRAPRGTQDVLPSESYKWQYIEKLLFDISFKYGFKEIRVPTFEHTDLFCRSVGDVSDVVEKEMYTFEDRSSRLITLRPEGTAGVVRSVLENNLLNNGLPLKLSYALSCFRYEKPDAGRLREFHQFGIELFGSDSPQADFEVIYMANEMLRSFGISDLVLNINSIGCQNCRRKYQDLLIRYLKSKQAQLCEICNQRLNKNPLRILDCKNDNCQKVLQDAPIIIDVLCDDCQAHFCSLQRYLDEAQVSYKINPKIVRGLDYYTKTVFEFTVNMNGSDLTICGGGRYDNLIAELGGPQTPAFGFGMGLERLKLVLDNNSLLKVEDRKCDIYVITLDDKAKLYSIGIINKLRAQNYIVETDLMGRSLKAQMKYANKINARNVLVVGDDEIRSGKAKLKNMETSEVTEFII